MTPTGVTPSPLDALRERAKSLYHAGRLRESLDAHEEALRLAPEAVLIHLSAARIAHVLEMQECSLRHFEDAARLDPACFPAIEAARRICIGAGIGQRAQHYTALAQALHPSPEAQLSLQLFVPCINDSPAAIREVRSGYARGLEAALVNPPRFDRPPGALGISAFFLAYHGENDRELQIGTAALMRRVIPSLDYTAPHCLAPRRRAGRIRVGFISRFFAAHSIYATSIGLIEQLSRERFEVVALRITPSRDDDSTARVRAAADRTVDLHPDLFRAREQIAALALDILFYQDIGMEQTSYFLAFARLAPVQCVSFGHPNTTGIPTMDYFVSNDLFEPAEAASHYSERLVLLRDLPTLAYYHRPPVPVAPAGRASFGLPESGNLYVCPQTLYKLHPDFDALLAGILAQDPQGIIVLIEGQFRAFTELLRSRFQRTLASLSARVVFLPFMPFERFMRLLCIADVILDTPHFNGMNSSLQAFAAGVPVVTLPGRLQRGRHTQAMYRRMQITDCIAADAQSYVAIAVRIGTDRALADDLRRRIGERSEVLFDDPRVVAEFERFFVEAMADAR